MHADEPNAPAPAPMADADSWFTPWRCALLLGLLLCLTFPGVIAGVNSFFFRDFGTLGYPFVHYHRESFWRGELPFWNPLSNCGTPFLAQWNTLVLYPFSAIYLLIPLPWGLNYFCLAHLFVAGLGMYYLARRWVGNGFAATVASVAYVFGGVTLSSHIYPNYLVTLAWMPFVVWLTERAWREGGRMVVLAALAGALQMLSGAPELILQTWLLVTVLCVAEGCRRCQTKAERGGADGEMGSTISRAVIARRLVLVIVLIAGLCAVQLLPFFDLLAHSQRGLNFGGQLWSMPGWGWANLLVPLFHCFHTPQGVYFQVGQAFLVSYYMGAGVLALGLLAVWQSWRGVAATTVWLWATLLLLSLILALGENGFVYSWVRETLPCLGLVRYPIKFVYLAAFLMPLLAAYGVSALGRAPDATQRHERARVLTVGAGMVLLMAGLAYFAYRYPFPGENVARTVRSAGLSAGFLLAILGGVLWRNFLSTPGWRVELPVRLQWILRLAILLLLWLDVQTHTPYLTPVIANSVYTPNVAQFETKPQSGQARVMLSPHAERLIMTRTLPDFGNDFVGARLALWSNLNALEGIPKVNGAATLQLRQQSELEAVLYASPTNDFPRLARFLGVAYVSSPRNPVEWVTRTNYQPLVTVGQRAVFLRDQEAFAAVLSPNFEPRQVVYLPLAASTHIVATNPASARIVESHFSPQRIAVRVEAASTTMLVLAQSYYHRWQATVDGQPVRLWRANYGFQALEVPAGPHQVRLTYVDRRFWLGAGVSGVTLAGCLAGWFWRRRRT